MYFMKPECSVIKEKTSFASYFLLIYLLLKKN